LYAISIATDHFTLSTNPVTLKPSFNKLRILYLFKLNPTSFRVFLKNYLELRLSQLKG